MTNRIKQKTLNISLILLLGLAVIPFTAGAAVIPTAPVTVKSIESKSAGNIVEIEGTSTFPEVVVKVLRPNATVLFLDTAIISSGTYHLTFTLPSDTAVGTYQIIVGQGATVATTSMIVLAVDSSIGSQVSVVTNSAGSEMKITVSSSLNTSYPLDKTKFVVNTSNTNVGSVNAAAAINVNTAAYDSADSTHRTIILKFTGTPFLGASTISLSLAKDAFETQDGRRNAATSSATPSTTFDQLDVVHDGKFSIDDIVTLITSNLAIKDMNHDGTFNSNDIAILLSLIKPISVLE